MPVPPPISEIGRCPVFWNQCSIMIWIRPPACRLGRGRVEADIGRHGFLREQGIEPVSSETDG